MHAVWRVLRKEGICLQRQRSWCVSTDKEFVPKAADIVGLYLNPPEKALVICVDEKPSIQALERKTGYVETDNGKIVRAYQKHLQAARDAQLLCGVGGGDGTSQHRHHRTETAGRVFAVYGPDGGGDRPRQWNCT